MLHEPAWWYRAGASWQSALLSPAAALYAGMVQARWSAVTPSRAGAPVVCIGNFTLGGAGKTPAAIAVARILQELYEQPVFLTRGYGGRIKGPHRVDPASDTAARVGDEPLLLARVAPTVVSADRVAGAAQALALGATVVVMDDGFQNPGLAKDLSVVAVDGERGLGNGRVMPSGPLRAPLGFQMARADALLIVGPGDAADALAAAMTAWRRVVLRGTLAPTGDTAWLAGARLVAFAGIGRPDKFFAMLESLGAELAARVAFPDHHPFAAADAERLLALAREHGAPLITTEKDWTRIAGKTGALRDLKSAAEYLPVALSFDDRAAMVRLLQSVLRPSDAAT